MKSDVIDLPEADKADGCPHPREVYSLIGHLDAEAKFLKAKSTGHMHHAWLLTGGPGIGKATLAYRMIRSILGGNSQLETSLDVPRSDPVSQRIESLGHGDFLLIRRPYDHKLKKLRSEIPVSEARKVAEFFSKRSSEGGWRVCLIDCLDDMNRNSENAILKTLEEPPERAVLILLANNPGRLLPTIRSRCMNVPLREVPQDAIENWLRAQIGRHESDSNLKLAVQLSRGAPGRALALYQNADLVLSPIKSIITKISRNGSGMDMKSIEQLTLQKNHNVRALFWEALQDVTTVFAKTASGQEWPFELKKPVLNDCDYWTSQWQRIVHMQNREKALNIDKKSVMLDIIGRMRAA